MAKDKKEDRPPKTLEQKRNIAYLFYVIYTVIIVSLQAAPVVLFINYANVKNPEGKIMDISNGLRYMKFVFIAFVAIIRIYICIKRKSPVSSKDMFFKVFCADSLLLLISLSIFMDPLTDMVFANTASSSSDKWTRILCVAGSIASTATVFPSYFIFHYRAKVDEEGTTKNDGSGGKKNKTTVIPQA